MNPFRKMASAAGKTLFPEAWQRRQDLRAAEALHREWDRRIAEVAACPDNTRVPRVPEAGRIVDGTQVMHNGLRVIADGYYGDGITRMLSENRGCHEPQEEAVFGLILQSLPAGASMIEAGAYWGFYSMWFCQVVQGGRVWLIEPDPGNLEVGRRNFQLNGFDGDFTRAYVGKATGVHPDGTPLVDITTFAAEKGLDRLDILHADVQEAEMDLLQGARSLIADFRIAYLFISTHSDALHRQCLEFLESLGYRILVSVPMTESYSEDGVLVAHSPQMTPPPIAEPSRKNAAATR